jgi:hypothetical protein
MNKTKSGSALDKQSNFWSAKEPLNVIDAYKMGQVFNVCIVIEPSMVICAQICLCFQLTTKTLNFIVFSVKVLIIIMILKRIKINRKNLKNYKEILLIK